MLKRYLIVVGFNNVVLIKTLSYDTKTYREISPQRHKTPEYIQTLVAQYKLNVVTHHRHQYTSLYSMSPPHTAMHFLVHGVI
jgi:hypothetical protein